MIIAVAGRGDGCSPEAYRLAEEVGFEIGLRGHTLVCGGGNGVMEGACKGARSAGGKTIGILPGGAAADANPYIDIPIVTGMGFARNVIVVRTALAVIAIDGAYGTLSEVALALGYDIPVIGPNGEEDAAIIKGTTTKDAVRKAIAAAEQRATARGSLP